MGLFSNLFSGSKEESKETKKVDLPESLSELKALRENKPKLRNDCDQAIMRLIQKAYDEDKLVFDSASEYSYTKVLGQLQFLLEQSFAIRYEHPEREEGYILYLNILDRAFELSQADPGLTFKFDGEFGADVWYESADILTDGKYVPRDVRRAILLTRKHIMFTLKMQQKIWWMDLERLLHIPADGEDSKKLFMSMNALLYGCDGRLLSEGYIRENYHALELAQLAEYLYQMDYEALRSDDHTVLISTLNKAVADGNPFAKYLLGQYYIKGVHVDADFEKGVALVDEAVQAGLSLPANYLSGAYSDKRDQVDYKNKKERAALEKKSDYYQTMHDQLKKQLPAYIKVVSEYLKSAEVIASWQPPTPAGRYDSASTMDSLGNMSDPAEILGAGNGTETNPSGFPFTMTDTYGVQWSLLNDMGYAAEYVSADGTHRTVSEEALTEGNWHF